MRIRYSYQNWLNNSWFFINIKGCVRYIFASLFLSLKESTFETKQNVFISLQKLFLFSRKPNFRVLDIQISLRHQMPKHKTRSIFYWITWEANTICKWNLASLCHITKEKKSSKNSTKTTTWNLVPGPFVFAKN